MSRKRNRRLARQAQSLEGERLYMLSQVADRAQLTLRTIQNHVAQGALKVTHVGPFHRPRVKASELEKYLGLGKIP